MTHTKSARRALTLLVPVTAVALSLAACSGGTAGDAGAAGGS